MDAYETLFLRPPTAERKRPGGMGLFTSGQAAHISWPTNTQPVGWMLALDSHIPVASLRFWPGMAGCGELDAVLNEIGNVSTADLWKVVSFMSTSRRSYQHTGVQLCVNWV